MSKTTYFNEINYTTQAVGRTYTEFTNPLSSNKILLYITALDIWATGRDTTYGFYPMELRVSYQILNQNVYRLDVELEIYTIINKLQFSMIVFNSDDVQSSQRYVIVYSIW
jgi:hypothetical protein